MKCKFDRFTPKKTKLRTGILENRFKLNRHYVASLKNENLLQNFLIEAGFISIRLRNSLHGTLNAGDELHWGWETPACQLRGHFLGHWLSAAARIWASIGDFEIKAKADSIVAELARCQKKNGGEWCGSFPEKYMDWLAAGTPTWAPQYVIHKTFMGLYDMYAHASNSQALEIADRFANWMLRWSKDFSREKMDNILNVETGGMLEVWADLYGATGEKKYLDLIRIYTRNRLFQPLLDGSDPLTNMHANTTIPEAHGAARCYEVTGEERWRRIAEAYWKCAVTDRGYFCTGGQTSGEIWLPPFEFAARRGNKNQEHCVVYNMIRLADYLLRWTGDSIYADYIERNLYNGILSQQNPVTGMITYFQPLEAGGRKLWGHPTNDFWCCHGSLVQAHAIINSLIYYETGSGIAVSQYIPSELDTEFKGAKIKIIQELDRQNSGSSSDNANPAGSRHRPENQIFNIRISCDRPSEFTLDLRLPYWISGKPEVTVNGQPCEISKKHPVFEPIQRTWKNDTVRIALPKSLWTDPIPDEPNTVAFMDGPLVLAGLCDRELRLHGDKCKPSEILVPDNEREWGNWLQGYRTVGQESSIRFKPLYEIVDEQYTLYFPVGS